MTENPAGASEADSMHRGGLRPIVPIKPDPYVGTLGVFLGAGIATLYGRLLSIGLPDLRGALGLGFDEASWITTVYNMALMFMGPLSVYLGALFGVRSVLLVSGAVFIACCLALPLIPGLPAMLLLQAVAGLASGTFYPLTLAYALRALPIRFAIYGIGAYSLDILSVTNLATPLEAWIRDSLSWRWIFWSGVVLTPLMMLCIARAIPPAPRPAASRPAISWVGFFLASVGLAVLYGALDQGQRLDWLGSDTIAHMLGVGVLLIVAAAVRRAISPNPLINFRFLIRRNTMILCACLFAFRFVMLAVALLIPGFLAVVHGYGPEETGRVLLWPMAPEIAVGVFAAWLMRRLDGRVVLATGFAIIALACLMNAQLSPAWSGDDFWLPQLVIAVGLPIALVGLVGCLTQQLLETGAVAQPINVLTYSAFLHLVRLLGGEAGTVAMQRLISEREHNYSNTVGAYVGSGSWQADERLHGLARAFHSSSDAHDAQGRAAIIVAAQVRAQAYTLAYINGFTAIAVLAGVTVLLIACMKPMKIYFSDTALPLEQTAGSV